MITLVAVAEVPAGLVNSIGPSWELVRVEVVVEAWNQVQVTSVVVVAEQALGSDLSVEVGHRPSLGLLESPRLQQLA